MADAPKQNHLLNYQCADATLAMFHADRASLVRIVMGPRGSGKSVSAQYDIVGQAIEMPAQIDGVRRSRYIVTRNSYRALEASALATHKMLFRKMKGYNDSEIAIGREPWKSFLRFPLPDGTKVELEIVWMAVADGEWDKLRSVEYTGAYINELGHDYADTTIVTKIIESAGRYPPRFEFPPAVIEESERTSKPIYRVCIVADTNPPSQMHPLIKMMDSPPQGWAFFTQTPGIIETPLDKYRGDTNLGVVKDGYIYTQHPTSPLPRLHNAGAQYWLNMIPGADRATIDSSVLGKPARSLAGKPVYQFDEDCVYRSPVDVQMFRRNQIVVGCDHSGLNPAASICAVNDGVLWVLDEIAEPDISFTEFLQDLLLPLLRSKFAGFKVLICLDPAAPRSALDKRTVLQLCHQAGLSAVLASTNNPTTRVDSVKFYMNKRKGFVVSGEAEVTLLGLRGDFRFENVRGRPGVFKDSIDKTTRSSHVMDSLGYAALYFRGRSEMHTENSNTEKVSLRRTAKRIV